MRRAMAEVATSAVVTRDHKRRGRSGVPRAVVAIRAASGSVEMMKKMGMKRRAQRDMARVIKTAASSKSESAGGDWLGIFAGRERAMIAAARAIARTDQKAITGGVMFGTQG